MVPTYIIISESMATAAANRTRWFHYHADVYHEKNVLCFRLISEIDVDVDCGSVKQSNNLLTNN